MLPYLWQDNGAGFLVSVIYCPTHLRLKDSTNIRAAAPRDMVWAKKEKNVTYSQGILTYWNTSWLPLLEAIQMRFKYAAKSSIWVSSKLKVSCGCRWCIADDEMVTELWRTGDERGEKLCKLLLIHLRELYQLLRLVYLLKKLPWR